MSLAPRTDISNRKIDRISGCLETSHTPDFHCVLTASADGA